MSDAAMSDAPPGEAPPGEAPVEEKKKRGKPKDEHAPPKPRNPYGAFCGECRVRLKETRPELISDLAGMGTALAEEWAKVSDAEKARLQAQYEKEMEVWKPLWSEYKKTPHYKEFVEVKTDYLDKRAQKKLVKTMNKEAPKRPKSGYMIFAGEVREKVMEEVKAQGLGLGDAGTMISVRWAALTEGQKARYGEQSQEQRIEFDKTYGVYKQTEAFGSFCDAKAKLESKQQLKKIERVCLDAAPKRPSSAFALFRGEVIPDLVKENAEKKEGEAKMTTGDMAKKIAEMWGKVDDNRKAGYNARAEKLKAEYDVAYAQFKAAEKYTEFLEKRQKIKIRENTSVHLREMPKKPKSVFALFAKAHKDEVTNEEKKNDALKQKFEKASKEEKEKLMAENEKMTEEWKKEVDSYKSGTKYKTYESTKNKIMEEFKNEAIKVTTLKFLSDSPSAPPKTPFSVFIGEKRKASGTPEGAKRSKDAKREEVVQAEAQWKKLPETVKDEYETKRKELLQAYEAEIKAFMAGEKWQDYQKEAKRLRIPIRSLLFHKKKVIQKLKDGKPNPNSIELPAKPEIYPSKPLNALQTFIADKKKTVEAVSEISEMWSKLSADEKATWDQKAAEQVKKYEEDMEAFRNTQEGKKYSQDLASATRRRRLILAKNKYLDDLPKQPASALFLWMKKNASSARKENPEGKGFEIKKILEDRWKALPEEEKDPLVKAAEEKMQEFTTKMAEFKASDNYKKYVSATKSSTFKKKVIKKVGKKKKVVKAVPSGPAAPESMPKKPLNAFQFFARKEAAEGRKGKLPELQRLFAGLSEDEKRAFLKEADERTAKYREELATFEKSVEGRKFRQISCSFLKRKRLKELSDKFLKDQPKKNPVAFFLFIAGNRAKVAKENPELKGLGPVQQKLSQMWKDLNAEERQEWTDKEKEETVAYEEKLAEFHATDAYKAYRRSSAILLRPKFSAKSKGKAKAKAKAKVVDSVPMPEKPKDLPVAPKNSFFLFCDDTRKKGTATKLGDINKLWLELGADGQKEYNLKAETMKKEFDAKMIEFQKTADGKKYFRLKAAAERKMRLKTAKKRFLGGADAPTEPKRPSSSYFLFLAEMGNRPSQPNQTREEKAKELTSKWSGLSPEEKGKYEAKAKELKEKYEEDLKVYKGTAAYKNYDRTLNIVTGKKAKEMARIKAKRAALQAAQERAKAAKAKKDAKPAPRGPAPAKSAAKPAAAKANGSDEMGSDSGSSKKSSKSSKSSSSSSDSD